VTPTRAGADQLRSDECPAVGPRNYAGRSVNATSAPRHRVLMLAYYFPPLGGGGVQRTLKHVKYLSPEGFDAIVVTSDGRGFPLRDPLMAREIPPRTVVLRSHTLPVQVIRWKLEGLLRRIGLPTWPASVVGWPDELVGWLPGALYQALRAVRRYRPDVLYTTSSPVTAHVAGMIVQRITGLPWVADFRDPWTRHPHAARQFAVVTRASEALERSVMSRIDQAVIADESVELLGLTSLDPRVVIIRNGVDPDDLAECAPVQLPSYFRLSYVGSLYGSRDGAPVFDALHALARRGVLEQGDFELRLVGDAKVPPTFALGGLPVTRTGYVDHRQALEEMTSASALLLYLPPVTRGSSGKLFEYLASGRPVLCVARRDNLAYRLVDELGAGPCVEPHDVEAIERAIERLVAQWRSGTLTVDPIVREETLRRFSRCVLAAQLADVLRKAIHAGGGPQGETASRHRGSRTRISPRADEPAC
jgi:glycosyltransferase involved in cell wall biosynthesis